MRALIATAALAAFGAGQASATLVAHYDFNESSGATVLDDKVGTADGTVSNVNFVASTAGAPGSSGFGNAGAFNGTSSMVSFGTGSHPSSFDLGTGDFTISGWLRTPDNTETGVAGNRPVFGAIDYNNAGWMFEIGRDDRSYGDRVMFTVRASPVQVVSNAELTDNQWHWVAVVSSGGTLTMYVDGVRQSNTDWPGSVSTGGVSASAPPAHPAYFGENPDIASTSVNYAGELDEWRIYNHALTGATDGSGNLTGGELFDVWQQNVPEPGSLSLLLIGGALALRRRRG